MRQTLTLPIALAISLILATPLVAQVVESVTPVAVETVKQPERKLKLITESAPGYIPKYSNTTGGLTESLLLESGGGITVFGGMALSGANGRLYFNFPAGFGGDMTGTLNGAETFSIGFHNEAGFSGTVGQATGRTLYVYDRMGSAYRGAVDGQGTWWFGSSPTNFGLKVLAPAGSTVGMTIDSSGNVGIGGASSASHKLKVTGNVDVAGTVTGSNIKAHYQDIAEWVPSTSDLTPGTVVVLNLDRDNQIMASATAYDTAVAGVVSAQPGLSLGIESEDKEQIATTGRVKVRVDARSKPIRVGDLLVTSNAPGTAMRSEPMNVNGRPFHQPGTIIGKALQSLDGGVGEILVLLSMQ
jgi:hypothetical protein